MAPECVIVGAPGSGKTTVGQLLADRLGSGFRDTDHDIERAAGRSIPDIFVEDGEDAFRALEADAVRDALRAHDGVLSLGGGAVLDEGTRALLADQPVVWLQVTAGQAAARVGLNTPRPVLVGNVRGQLINLLAARTPLYEQVAKLGVETDGRTPEQIVDIIVAAIRGGNLVGPTPRSADRGEVTVVTEAGHE